MGRPGRFLHFWAGRVCQAVRQGCGSSRVVGAQGKVARGRFCLQSSLIRPRPLEDGDLSLERDRLGSRVPELPQLLLPLVCVGFTASLRCPLTSPQSVKIPKIAVETQTGNEKGAGSWRADRQETGGLSAPREEANFRQLRCQSASSARACCQISAGPGASARPLSAARVWPSNMALVSQLWGRRPQGAVRRSWPRKTPDSQSEEGTGESGFHLESFLSLQVLCVYRTGVNLSCNNPRTCS